uniref:Uncharacterized protein LOC104230493 n=1 Tax=Nicotiana sylvestris TaxID=4096 RepID=A0A1U7X420_NICSY|nr:PREDICTED: uncharacterized protein LOC104230493 [Nicotiana sylvestris]
MVHQDGFLCLTWQLIGGLSTRERLASWGVTDTLVCPLCNVANETIDHLFFSCVYSSGIWNILLQWQGLTRKTMSWQHEMAWMEVNERGRSARAEVSRMAIAGCVYHIWQERNMRIFQNKQRQEEQVIRQIIQEIFCRGSMWARLAKKLERLNFYP